MNEVAITINEKQYKFNSVTVWLQGHRASSSPRWLQKPSTSLPEAINDNENQISVPELLETFNDNVTVNDIAIKIYEIATTINEIAITIKEIGITIDEILIQIYEIAMKSVK